MPMVAALSAAHLAAILFPPTLRRLYIVPDDDPAGDGAMASLIDRANEERDRGDYGRHGWRTSTRISAASVKPGCKRQSETSSRLRTSSRFMRPAR